MDIKSKNNKDDGARSAGAGKKKGVLISLVIIVVLTAAFMYASIPVYDSVKQQMKDINVFNENQFTDSVLGNSLGAYWKLKQKDNPTLKPSELFFPENIENEIAQLYKGMNSFETEEDPKYISAQYARDFINGFNNAIEEKYTEFHNQWVDYEYYVQDESTSTLPSTPNLSTT